MGYLLHFLVALLGQGLAEAGWSTGWRAPWAVPLLAGLPYFVAWSSRRIYCRGNFRASAALLRVLSVAGPALHVVAVCAFGWTKTLHAWLGAGIELSGWPRFGLLLTLLPFVVYEIAAIDARARVTIPSSPERRAWVSFQTRMLLSALIPLVGYVVVSAVVGTSESLRVQIEEVPAFGAAFATAMLLVLVLALPSLLRNVWDTVPFPPGRERELLGAVAERARFRARALLAWNTGDLMANAAIVGIGPRTRVVLFSDALLAQLDGPELAAVFAHEIGHAVRRHVLIFVAWAAGFFLLADVAANYLFPGDPWLAGGFVLAAVVAWIFAFGFASRRFELEADLYCLELLGDASALIRALEKVGGRFRDVASWRHFSTAERVRFLEGAATDPRIGEALRRGLRRWTRVGLVLLLVACTLQASSLARSFPEDRLRADLRLGHYASAHARAAAIDHLDPHLAELVAGASSLGHDEPPLAELETLARSAMARADVAGALAWLDLAALRGSADLEAVASALREFAEKGAEPAEALEARLHAGWRAEFEACRPQ